ncbi:lymphocyte antigen 6E-like [Podarcis raffonei]|uniref:lymphocyte antigen 6E-like n=1 Tax=Podarcis raffonei TaxID=65483 RepID=UPI0023291D18|nr:lymphocyte antigen 6E-like [Podarcis raffonei]
MKTCFFVPLCVLLLLCINEVHPLWCFTCEPSSSNLSCLKATKCSENDKHCMTTVASFRIGFLTVRKRITKKCSPSCPNLNMDMGIGAFQTSCCQSFLCNLFGHITAKNETR